ncbi:MAG: Sapep family Mn(2+)-dependent dipeptidase [Clostridia bacterium]|nr:Sapep family Mn(2+)-dependent dipeptidase [Clostridia bacterium]
MEYLNDIIKSISSLVKHESWEHDPEEGAPFGKGAANALKEYLDLAQSFGFETHNYDNYAGEVIFGEGEEFAILAHLDVVPAGNGWTHDPFGGEIDEEKKRIWGRGTVDDKGPAVISLYTLKALKDKGFEPKRKIKLIVGCNEESGWACLDHYNKVAHMPKEGISPDANFPVLYAEKGILHVKIRFELGRVPFSDFHGGTRANMVCDLVTAKCPPNAAKMEKYGVTCENGLIVSRGVGAHGSTPEEGKNAMEAMLGYLGLDGIYDLLFIKKLGLEGLEDETGKLTLSPDIVSQTEEDGKNTLFVTCDIRYPATMKREDILKIIGANGLEYEITNEQAPLYNDKNGKLITTLCDVYNEITGKNLKPLAIGGGTYARALKCGAAFGPEEDEDDKVMHQANEYISFDKIERCFKIYTTAIERLTK